MSELTELERAALAWRKADLQNIKAAYYAPPHEPKYLSSAKERLRTAADKAIVRAAPGRIA